MSRNQSAIMRAVIEYAGLLGALLALVLLFSIFSDRFLSVRSFTTIANQTADLTLIAVGMTFVLLVTGIDLSVGSVLALCGSVAGVALVEWGWPVAPVILLAIGVGLFCGILNGALSVMLAVPSFIVTLAMLEMARGTAFIVADSKTKYIGSHLEFLAAPIAEVGVSLAFLISVFFVCVAQVVLSATVFGRNLFAIGGNRQAALYSGIRVDRYRIATFAILGALTGLAAVFHAARLSAADPNAGVGLELSAIAAAVIGGTSLAGGKGSAVSTFLGVAIIGVLQSGLAQIGATEPTKRIVTGLVILLAVVADAYRHRIRFAKQLQMLQRFWKKRQR